MHMRATAAFVGSGSNAVMLGARKAIERPDAEEADVRTEIEKRRRAARGRRAASDVIGKLVVARVEDLVEDERVGGVVTDEDRPPRPAQPVPRQPTARRQLAVDEPQRAPDGRRLDQHLRDARSSRPSEDRLGRLGAGDTLDELPDRHWTAGGRTEPALLLSGAVTDGRSTLSHLGVNALFLEPRMGGIETYVRELYPAIIEARPDLRISMFVNERGRELIAAEPWADGVQLVTHPLLGIRGRPGARARRSSWTPWRAGAAVSCCTASR